MQQNDSAQWNSRVAATPESTLLCEGTRACTGACDGAHFVANAESTHRDAEWAVEPEYEPIRGARADTGACEKRGVEATSLHGCVDPID